MDTTTPTPAEAMPLTALPTEAEYAAHGLRVAVVGAAGTGKTHVCRAVRQLGVAPAPRTYDYPSLGLEHQREQLDALKREITSTHALPDITGHIHVVWYLLSLRWETADVRFVRELARIAHVIVVIAKLDQRLLDVDAAARTAADNLELAVRQDFPSQTVVRCGDPSLSSGFWLPPACPRGHDRDNFEVSALRRTWQCKFEVVKDGRVVICDESHTGEYPPIGYDQLVRETNILLPDVYRRCVLCKTSRFVRVMRATLSRFQTAGSCLLSGVKGLLGWSQRNVLLAFCGSAACLYLISRRL